MEPKKSSASYQSFIAEKLKSYNQCGINELRGRRIRACFHGWVILSNHLDSVLWSLWNPITSKLIRLPPLTQREEDSYECCLSSPPDDQSSVFLLLPEETPTIVFCRLDGKRKGLKWIEMLYAKKLSNLSGVDYCFLECLTCCNGKVYALTTDWHYIIHVDIMFKGNEIVISLLPFLELPYRGSKLTRVPSRDSFGNIRYFLKESCTKLFFIKICFKEDNETMIGDVYLFKLDMTSMRWKEMVDIKDDIFFLKYASDNSYSIFYKSGVTSEISGCVHILGEMDNIVYSFHVKDRTMSLSLMSGITGESQVLVWAMLECRSEVDHHESKQEKEQDKDIEIVVRPVSTEYNSPTSETHLLNLPFHILEMIMEHCFGVEYMRFRTTCTRCCLAAPLIQWSSVSPWLTVLDNYRGIITFIDPIRGDKYFIKTPQALKGDYQICCSRYGWLLMREANRGNIVFLNPFTRNIVKLPWLGIRLDSLCFSAPPTSPNCVVVGFTTFGSWHVCIHFVSHEPPSWHKYALDFGTHNPYSFHIPTFSGQDIYTLCDNEGIHAFRDISEGDYSWEVVKHKVPRSSYISPTEFFISKCDQHLLLVIVGEYGKSVKVFKLNHSTKEWEKLDGLGKHMIYISNTSCICLEAKSSEMGNKIYFPRWQNKDAKIVFYSLETCGYHTFDDKNMQESFGGNLFETKDPCYPHTWIEPSWS